MSDFCGYNIVVQRPITELARHFYVFDWTASADGVELHLVRCGVERRRSLRCKWKCTQLIYDRINGREAETREEPSTPADVVVEAVETLRSRVGFHRWSDRWLVRDHKRA